MTTELDQPNNHLKTRGVRIMVRTRSIRTLLRANATFATATGLTALVATGPVSRLVGVEEHRLISATGAGLLVFAAGLILASGARTARLIQAGRLISLADGLWVVGSIGVLLLADLPIRGDVIIALLATLVAGFAALQVRALALVDEAANDQVVEVSKILDGSVEDVWAAVIDHETYGRLAPNLSKVRATGPDGPDLSRRCGDTRGRHWDETCVLWEPGRKFAAAVDTAAPDYPYPLDHLRGEWAVRSVGHDKTKVTVRFELRPKPGPAGSAFATAMTTGAKPLVRRIMKGWQEIVSTPPAGRVARQRG